jgi:hypothetical protein
MKRAISILILVSCLSSCNLPSNSPIDSPLQDTVDAMSAVKAGQVIPDHLLTENAERTGEEFDPNLYFTALNHLNMDEGYVLDYVYYYDGMGGRPVLYARTEGQQSPFRTYEEFAASPQYADAYLDHVQVDGTTESYFQLVLLSIMGGQFYLDWHANYNDTRVVCDSEALETLLEKVGSVGNEMSAATKARARRIDLEPVIEIKSDIVSVQVVTFTKWGGFFRETYTLKSDFPHTILDVETEELVPYDCGIMF